MHDVALNNTDICVGSTWVTESRRRIAPFTSSIKNIGIHVITKRNDASDLTIGALLYQPFKPFSNTLWLSLLACLVYAGYAAYILDASGYVRGPMDRDEHAPAFRPPMHRAASRKFFTHAVCWLCMCEQDSDDEEENSDAEENDDVDDGHLDGSSVNLDTKEGRVSKPLRLTKCAT